MILTTSIALRQINIKTQKMSGRLTRDKEICSSIKYHHSKKLKRQLWFTKILNRLRSPNLTGIKTRTSIFMQISKFSLQALKTPIKNFKIIMIIEKSKLSYKSNLAVKVEERKRWKLRAAIHQDLNPRNFKIRTKWKNITN